MNPLLELKPLPFEPTKNRYVITILNTKTGQVKNYYPFTLKNTFVYLQRYCRNYTTLQNIQTDSYMMMLGRADNKLITVIAYERKLL